MFEYLFTITSTHLGSTENGEQIIIYIKVFAPDKSIRDSHPCPDTDLVRGKGCNFYRLKI